MELNDNTQPVRPRRSYGALTIEFLGSMNMAITLLVVIAIAAVIGTVLQQNQPYTDYEVKFGPFWFVVFHKLGLYNIYDSSWFMGLLGFLLISTSICIWRSTPHILRDMRQHRTDVEHKSLMGFHLKGEWRTARTDEQAAQTAGALLRARGYGIRQQRYDDHVVVAGMKGSIGRIGYILTHLAIVVICVGALIDTNLPLRFKEWRGEVKAETANIPAAQVPASSTLPASNKIFRGTVTIPEGDSANFLYLQLGNGYLVQNLPFTIALDKFRIKHYPSGMPRSFESDIKIFDNNNKKEVLHTTIAVNHPLDYKGYTIFQASFADGGSHLQMKAWSLDLPADKPLELNGTVNHFIKLTTPRGKRTIEFTNFKLYNIFPVDPSDKSGKKFRNYGPSFIFKVRDPSGEALEYVNYMAPQQVNGREFFMSGVRSSPAEPYRYLYIPIDSHGGIERFMQLLAATHDQKLLKQVVAHQVDSQVTGNSPQDKEMRATMQSSIVRLVNMFVAEGIDGVLQHMRQNVAADKQQDAMNSYIKVLQSVLGDVYVKVLRQDHVDLTHGVSNTDSRYFEDAMNAMAMLGPYGSPFYLQLTNFQQVQASGLEITRAPGKDVVYFGSVMLILGVFMMFYLHQRRVWVWLASVDGKTEVLFAGSGHRNRTEFETEFSGLQTELQKAVPPDVS